jgi:hypothetical protein
MRRKRVTWRHWVKDDHICKWCGQPYTSSDCPCAPPYYETVDEDKIDDAMIAEAERETDI